MRDSRLDLGRYIRNPFNKKGTLKSQLDFQELFRAKPRTGQYPWNPSRFETEDLTKRHMTKKLTQNPDLNFVGNSAFFNEDNEVTSDYEVFEGVGRFNRPVDYDFDEGRPMTTSRPQDQPDFNPMWLEAYKVSPTIQPNESASNPMPRLRNPDPNGYLMAMAKSQVEAQQEGDLSVSELLEIQGNVPAETEKKEEKEGEEVVEETDVRESKP